MKPIFLVYSFIALLLLAILSVLSYNNGVGYVYALWRGVQIQTNVWFVSFAFLLFGLVFQVSWKLLKRFFNREKRKIQQVFDFNGLHIFEKLGVLWLLEGAAEQQAYLDPVFESSGLLKQVVDARVLYMNGHLDEALKHLQTSPADAFELAELQRIEIFLKKQDGQQALTHLEFLHGHELSPWLADLKDIYYQKLNKLWGVFAVQFPWLYLHSTQFGHLETKAKTNWLSKLLIEFDDASTDEWQLLIQRYQNQHAQIHIAEYDVRKLWLKILSRMPEMAEYHRKLALELLEENFDQEVFFLWFQQQLLKQNPDYLDIEEQIKHLENKYPSLPVFAFSLWYIYMETNREKEAEALLLLYPDNIMMSYLRIKSKLNGDAFLIQQLNAIFENDVNFLQVKI